LRVTFLYKVLRLDILEVGNKDILLNFFVDTTCLLHTTELEFILLGFIWYGILTSTDLKQIEQAIIHENVYLKHHYVLSQIINDMAKLIHGSHNPNLTGSTCPAKNY